MGHAFTSPLRRWDVIVGLCQSINARTYVEVGCKEGRTVGAVLANCPQIHAIAIDPWATQPKSDDPLRETYEDWDFAEIKRKFWENVGEHKGRCTMWRNTSQHAAEECDLTIAFGGADKSKGKADVVFVDALHDYASVKQDIALWWPKVREGGYLVFHDFNHKWPGVMRAVADSFPLIKVGVCPDSVAFVQKDSALKVAA